MSDLADRLMKHWSRKQEGEWSPADVEQRFEAHLINADLRREWVRGRYSEFLQHGVKTGARTPITPEYASDVHVAEVISYLLTQRPLSSRFFIEYQPEPHWYMCGIYTPVFE